MERLYTGEEPVDLDGLVLCDAASCCETVGLGVSQPGDVLLLGSTLDAYGVGADGTFDFALTNSGDERTLLRPGGELLDQMDYAWTSAGDRW